MTSSLDVVKAAVILVLAAIVQLTILNPLEAFDGSADLLLCDDRSRYCDPANDREQEKGPTPFSHIFASSI